MVRNQASPDFDFGIGPIRRIDYFGDRLAGTIQLFRA